MKKVSIIIPIYNNAEHVGQCINSILGQTINSDIEIICVDDGSTDESVNVIEKIGAENIVILHQSNKGAGLARNKGLMAATGEYVMFMDGDDYYPTDDVVESLYRAICTFRVDICFGNLLRVDKGREYGKFEPSRRLSNFDYEGYINTCDYQYPFVHYLCMFNRQFLINNNVLYPDRRRGQDIVFCAKAFICTDRVYHINKAVYVYRYGCKRVNYTFQKAKDYVEAWIEVIKLIDSIEKERQYIGIAYRELRVFSVRFFYDLALAQKDWSVIDSVNELFAEAGYNKRLLTMNEWKNNLIVRWKEKILVYGHKIYDYFIKQVFATMG